MAEIDSKSGFGLEANFTGTGFYFEIYLEIKSMIYFLVCSRLSALVSLSEHKPTRDASIVSANGGVVTVERIFLELQMWS